VLYLGDEASAAGWRLGGAEVRVCASGEEAAAFEATLAAAQGTGLDAVQGAARVSAQGAAPAAAREAAMAAAREPGTSPAGRAPPLVLVSAAVAGRLDAQRLRQAASALAPLVLVVPDPQGRAPRPDLAARLRLQLGLEG
jgi:vacuolar-type H+-ATPase subunit F/Vma7